MRHIRAKILEPYTVVIASEPLEEHLSILEMPNIYEIVDLEIPNYVQYLNYVSNKN